MNPEIKTLWIAALRSKEYEQGKGCLRKDDKFCCLGVLCDLAVKAGVQVSVVEVLSTGQFEYGSKNNYLPNSVREWAGLHNVLPHFRYFTDDEIVDRSVSAMNDGGSSFEEIADVIERGTETL